MRRSLSNLLTLNLLTLSMFAVCTLPSQPQALQDVYVETAIPLDVETAKELVANRWVFFEGAGDVKLNSGYLYYGSNGRVAVRLTSGFEDRGKWWVDDSQFCQQWQKQFSGYPFCFSVALVDKNTILTSNGYNVKLNVEAKDELWVFNQQETNEVRK